MPICKWEDEPEVKPTQDPRRHTPFALKEGDKVMLRNYVFGPRYQSEAYPGPEILVDSLDIKYGIIEPLLAGDLIDLNFRIQPVYRNTWWGDRRPKHVYAPYWNIGSCKADPYKESLYSMTRQLAVPTPAITEIGKFLAVEKPEEIHVEDIKTVNNVTKTGKSAGRAPLSPANQAEAQQAYKTKVQAQEVARDAAVATARTEQTRLDNRLLQLQQLHDALQLVTRATLPAERASALASAARLAELTGSEGAAELAAAAAAEAATAPTTASSWIPSWLRFGRGGTRRSDSSKKRKTQRKKGKTHKN